MDNKFNPKMIGVRVKRLRQAKELSILKLARESEVNKNTICNIEKGDLKTSLDSIYRIADALEVDVTQLLLNEPRENIDYHVDRFKKGNRKERKDLSDSPTYRIGDIDIHLKSGTILAGIIEVFADGKKEMTYHDGEELFFCLTGKILLNISGSKVVLNKGDCVAFWGSDPHNYTSIRNDDKKISVGLSVISGSKCKSLQELHQSLKTE